MPTTEPAAADDLPLEAEAGDFLVALERLADAEAA